MAENYSNVARNEDDAERGIERQESEDEINDGQPLGQIKENTFKEVLAGLLGGVSVSASILAMIMTSATTVTIAGIFACLIGPYSYWQQRNLTDVIALKKTHEALVKEIGRLKSENERLKGLVDELNETVTKLEDVEETLDYIYEMNVESVVELRDQVEVGKNILGLMRNNLKANALQNVITVVLQSDKDGNFQFDSKEVDDLIKNLKGINGLQLNEARFRSKIAKMDGNVDRVIELLDEVMVASPNNRESIVKY